VYDGSPVSRYGPGNQEDRFGRLGEASLYDSGDDWSRFEITDAEFERTWNPNRA